MYIYIEKDIEVSVSVDLPHLEIGVDHSVGETFTANTDTFKHTVTGQLVHNQVSINHTRLLHLVGNDATDEVRLCRAQSGHQAVQLLLVGRRHSGEATTLLATTALGLFTATGLSGVISEDFDQQFVLRLLELIDNGVVQRILVLLQPTGDVIGDNTSIMANGEVGSLLTGLWWFGLLEWSRLAQMGVGQLLREGLIGGLGEHRLFLQDGQDTHGL